MRPVRCLMLAPMLLAIAAGSAHAAEFKSVGAGPAILYDAPSEKARRVFIAPRGMPVEVVLTYGQWVKIRDSAGDLAWIESKILTSQRNVVTSAATTRIRAAADDSGTVVFSADKHVLLELVEPTGSGWVRVKHRDGQAGFAKASEVWGE